MATSVTTPLKADVRSPKEGYDVQDKSESYGRAKAYRNFWLPFPAAKHIHISTNATDLQS